MTLLRQRMLEDLQIRNYAPSTIECYIRSVAEFAKHFKKPPDQLGAEEIRAWQLFLLNEKRVKRSSYIQAICGLRFFYRNTLHRKAEIERLPFPRREKKLPLILSKEEVKALLTAPKKPGTPGDAGHAVRGRAPCVGSNQPECTGPGSQPRSDLGSGRQRSQGPARQALRSAARSTRRLLAVEAPHRLALPRNQARLPALSQKRFLHLQKSGPVGRYCQEGASALAASCFCHASAGGRRQPLGDHPGTACGHSDLRTTALYLRVSDTAIRSTKSPLEMLGSLDLVQSHRPPR